MSMRANLFFFGGSFCRMGTKLFRNSQSEFSSLLSFSFLSTSSYLAKVFTSKLSMFSLLSSFFASSLFFLFFTVGCKVELLHAVSNFELFFGCDIGTGSGILASIAPILWFVSTMLQSLPKVLGTPIT